MRPTFSRLLAEAARQDERVLLLTGDHGYALFDNFRSVRPGQYLNCGVAEQNMIGVAAGLAKGGFRPIVYGLSAFIPMRVLEQIKMDVCFESLPVIFIGDGAGVVYSQLGASHQCAEDVAALRAIPNLNIVSPADRYELAYCFKHVLALGGPSYVRFGKADRGDVHTALPQVAFGDPIQVRAGRASYAFVATGSMVRTALELADYFGDVPVWSVPTIAPVNEKLLRELCRLHKQLFVMEEHSVNGGLGSLVAERAAETGGCRVARLGIENRFSELCGSYSYLMSCHGLGAKELRERIAATLAEMDRHENGPAVSVTPGEPAPGA